MTEVDARFATVDKDPRGQSYLTDPDLDRIAIATRNVEAMLEAGFAPSTVIYMLSDVVDICRVCGWSRVQHPGDHHPFRKAEPHRWDTLPPGRRLRA